jgi:opacity protein-like surface antigen
MDGCRCFLVVRNRRTWLEGSVCRTLMMLTAAAVLVSAPAAAQSSSSSYSDGSSRVFVALNGGYHASSLAFDDTRLETQAGETASWTAGYRVDAGPGFDVGGGVRVWRSLVMTVATSRFTQSRRAAVSAELPHPFMFNVPRSVSGETQPLRHVEQAVHLGVGVMLPASGRLQLGLFGGPSVFSIQRDLLADVSYSESYPYDEAAYESATISKVSQTRTGFNVGGDVAYFVTDTVGIGGGVRFSRAEARLTSPATGEAMPVEAGGTQATVGLRLRFGGLR